MTDAPTSDNTPDPTANLPDELAAEMSKDERVSQSTALVRLAQSRYRFAQADDGRTFAVLLNGPNLALPLRGRDAVRTELAAAYFDAEKRAPSSSALADALNVIDGRAGAAEREALALRVATHDDGIVVDLGTADGRAVVVNGKGWTVTDRSPVLFRRTELTGALPGPVAGGSLDELRAHVNVSADAWEMLVGVLVCWLLPDVPRPAVLLIGEQGTGKTTAARMLAALIDPSPAQVRSAPRDLEAWVLAAAGSWVVALDNLSTVPEWLSDAICRACTGEGMVRRALYSDDNYAVTSFRRNIMLTTIDTGALRGDLGDRLVTVDLDVIGPKARKRDKAIAAAFTDADPRILGALLDLTAQVLSVLPSIELDDAPRMADFAQVLAAVDRVTGWHSLDAYRSLGAGIAAQVVESDPVANAIAALTRRHGTWTGTATELHGAITPERPPKGWPKTGRGVSGQLRRAAPALRTTGIAVEFHDRTPTTRGIVLTVVSDDGCDGEGASPLRSIQIEENGNDDEPDGWRDQPSQPSQPSSDPPDQRETDDGRDDGWVPNPSTVMPTVRTEHGPDQHVYHRHDGHDGCDGQKHDSSTEEHPPAPCDQCGKRTLRRTAGGAPRHTICEVTS